MTRLRSRVHRIVLLASIVACSILLPACSSVFVIKPTGRLNEDVSFRFYQAPEGVKQMKIKLTEFVVQEKSDASEWRTVWELAGSQDVDAITYGASVEGLGHVGPAKPLNARSKYRVIAREKLPVGPPGYSTVHFAFDLTGQVVEIDP